ncbi:MAG: beta-aspartyl-peptidase [Desulfitobacteriaceae bacterium]|nr:beta-aspartyl-peptidase [Desulfitobacteriaceae bacterium]MDD4752307.1 beta-aspartyl-peptidase [Desulfitobacteriaceae bacterium]
MCKLLKGGYCLTLENPGEKDILIVAEKIYKISEGISEQGLFDDVEVIDCSGKMICPGFIDQHVHITGGGGEDGPGSRIPEVMLSDLIIAGVTTVVGVLGVDSITRSVAGLLAKAKSLEAEGITAFIYTGSYGIPMATLTGKVVSDVALISEVLGLGELAISDHRSVYPSTQKLIELAAEVRVGGLLGGKAGVIHIHVGEGKQGLAPIFKLLEESDFPKKMFVPTHLNRNKPLFQQALQYVKSGGYIDLTAGETSGHGYSIPDALEILFSRQVNIENVTLSSDGNGSIPIENGGGSGIGKVEQLLEDVRSSILDKGFDAASVLKTVTINPAKVLNIYPRKGVLAKGSDADILVLNKDDITIDWLIAKGKVFIQEGKIVKKGQYER